MLEKRNRIIIAVIKIKKAKNKVREIERGIDINRRREEADLGLRETREVDKRGERIDIEFI
jgi:hypothetical protein